MDAAPKTQPAPKAVETFLPSRARVGFVLGPGVTGVAATLFFAGLSPVELDALVAVWRAAHALIEQHAPQYGHGPNVPGR